MHRHITGPVLTLTYPEKVFTWNGITPETSDELSVLMTSAPNP